MCGNLKNKHNMRLTSLICFSDGNKIIQLSGINYCAYYLLLFLYSNSTFATGLPSTTGLDAAGPVLVGMAILSLLVLALVSAFIYGLFFKDKNKDKDKDKSSDSDQFNNE